MSSQDNVDGVQPDVQPDDAATEPAVAVTGEADAGKGWGSVMKDLLSKRTGILFAHPALAAESQTADRSVDRATERRTDDEEEGAGHIGGVRGMPKVGLVKLWRKREQILSSVAETAAAAKKGVGVGWKGRSGEGQDASS